MSNYTIDLLDETETLSSFDQELVSNVIRTALTYESIAEESEISIIFVDEEKIHELNKEYRGIDRPTDVLSFALDEGDDVGETGEVPNLLGDIIISLPQAHAQAEEYGHDFHRELCFLAVHGFLHLVGYIHDSEEDEQKMFSRQEEILQEHGLKK
ncbi:rRNA maturation RNase YbeY [Salipaludibacillus sp. CF4.18]|uniref:rRNA maturation RNase YbeY n=1 Tax=Salipaludibacillus sp. CF4.18 TaxID=3373081 RepID=UPI003EE590D6